jgi:hypothetical protein
MRRLTPGLGISFAVAVLALLVVAPGGSAPGQRGPAQRANAGPPSQARFVGRCPAEGPMRVARPSQYPRAQFAAIRFAEAWWGGSGAAAVEHADGGFQAEASSLAEGNLGRQFSVNARVAALGHGRDAAEIAHLCGTDVLAATVAVDVRRSGKSAVTRLYMIHRPRGYLVWATH